MWAGIGLPAIATVPESGVSLLRPLDGSAQVPRRGAALPEHSAGNGFGLIRSAGSVPDFRGSKRTRLGAILTMEAMR